MRARPLALAALVVAGLAGAAWWALERREVDAVVVAGPALPGLAARVGQVDRIELVGAGGATLLALQRSDGQWRMPDRDDWPANQRQIGDALRLLAGAQRIEAKTADPARWIRLGVEDVAGAEAKGSELRLGGGGEPLRLTIGANHPALGGSYVRVGDDPQVWLLDADIGPAREPAAWLDRRLLDVPVARIERLRLDPGQGRAFELARVDDRFGLDGGRPEALADPDDGVATAGFTDQLALDDVAADPGTAATLRARIEAVDGIAVELEGWRDERGTWVRLQPSLDEARARAWHTRALAAAAEADAEAADDGAAPAAPDAGPVSLRERADAVLRAGADTAPVATDAVGGDVDSRVAALRTQVDGWRQRFAGRAFLLPAYKAALLLKTREDYLAGTP